MSQSFLRRLPVDVEVLGVFRCLSVLQDIVPKTISVAPDAHVVGHEVDNQPQFMGLRGFGQGLKAGGAAQLRIELTVIQDVVKIGEM